MMQDKATKRGKPAGRTAATPPKAPAARRRRAPSASAEQWMLRLYIAGRTARAVTALVNLERICEERLRGRYTVEVVDLLKNPRLAREDQIVAIPTLVRKLPAPMRKIIGNLSDEVPVLVGLQLRPRG